MEARTLTLVVTYQCTAACYQCCFGCHPQKKIRMPQQRLLNYIDQAADTRSVENVVFTGGECFLLGRDLKEAIRRATDRGLSTRCVTNGYWATSLSSARRRLQEFFDIGLREINFSTGDFHQDFVPYSNVVYGAVAAYELGMGIALMVETHKERSFTTEVLLKETVLGEIYRQDPEGMHIIEGVWISMQNDHSFNYDEYLYRGPNNPNLMHGCSHLLSNMVVTPDEKYLACCGLTAPQIPELCLGDARFEPLASIAARADKDLLRLWLRLEGPDSIVAFLQDRDSSLQYPWNNAHPCQTCRNIFHSDDIRAALQKYAREKETELMFRYYLWSETDRQIQDNVVGDGIGL
jgi:hypothetical protein